MFPFKLFYEVIIEYSFALKNAQVLKSVRFQRMRKKEYVLSNPDKLKILANVTYNKESHRVIKGLVSSALAMVLELVPTVNAQMKLFRSMDLSDMSKSYRSLEIIRTGIYVYWSRLNPWKKRKRRETCWVLEKEKSQWPRGPLALASTHPTEDLGRVATVCLFRCLGPAVPTDYGGLPGRETATVVMGNWNLFRSPMITDLCYLEGCLRGAADKERSEPLWVKHIWVI